MQEQIHRLDSYFSKWFRVYEITETRRKLMRGSASTVVDYLVSEDTNYIFVETISVLHLGRLGWAWTCDADKLVYFVLPETAYIVEPVVIREHLELWGELYGCKEALNEHGHTKLGMYVPLEKFAEVCESVKIIP